MSSVNTFKRPLYINICFFIYAFIVFPATLIEFSIWMGWVSESDLTNLILKLSGFLSISIIILIFCNIFYIHDSIKNLKEKCLSDEDEKKLNYFQGVYVLNRLVIAPFLLVISLSMMMDIANFFMMI